MTARDDLLRKLVALKNQRDAKAPEMVREWQSALHRLFRQIGAWIAGPVADGLFHSEEILVQVTEEVLGTYEAPSLKLLVPQDRAIYIVPKARRVVGAHGRVDLECIPKTVTLLRQEQPDVWQVATLTPERGGWTFQDFTEEIFWRSLAYLISYPEQSNSVNA